MRRLSAWRALWLALGDPFRMGWMAPLAAFSLFWIDVARLLSTFPGGVRWILAMPFGDAIAEAFLSFGWSDVIGLAAAIAFFAVAAPRALTRAGVAMNAARPFERAAMVAFGVLVGFMALTILAFAAEQVLGVAWHEIPRHPNDQVLYRVWGHAIIASALIWCVTISILRGATRSEVASPLFGMLRAPSRPISLLVASALFGTTTTLWALMLREVAMIGDPAFVGRWNAGFSVLGTGALVFTYAVLVKLAFIARLYFERDDRPETARVFD